MDVKRKEDNPSDAVGVEFHFTDSEDPKPPKRHELDKSMCQAWLEKYPTLNDCINYKILSLRTERPKGRQSEAFSIPFNAKTVEHAFWSPDVYYDLTRNPAGGATAFLDNPFRFMVQTPRDDGPFCSLAISQNGYAAKGVYAYDDDDFEPATIANGEVAMSGWRSNMAIISFPTAVLRAHSAYLSRNLAEVIRQIEWVESALSDTAATEFGVLSRTLHSCNSRLVNLERRSNFEKLVVSAIEAIVSKSRQNALPWPHLASQKSAIDARAYDFETLPRRIHNARAIISDLIQQHNEMMNLEIAQASRRMTEIAISDNASMKTIAIMTMIFLPGTAVASFFSMAMFDWSATDGSQIASKWLWIYFVVAVPLTGMVIAFWWIWANRSANHLFRMWRSSGSTPISAYEDIELANQPPVSGDVSETVIAGPDK